jgi:hypothetical protein
MSLLPGRILPQSEPIGRVNADGTVTADTNWWLLWYNLCLQTLGTTSSGVPADPSTVLQTVDIDAAGADTAVLQRSTWNAYQLALQADPPDITDQSRALLLAQDALLPDAIPQAQPVATITVGGSPFTYTAAFAGTVVVTGTVTSLSFKRQGTSVALGLTDGVFPLSRGDQLVVTYPATAPVLTFIPWSSQ